MINKKAYRVSQGLILSLMFSLSGCAIDGQDQVTSSDSKPFVYEQQQATPKAQAKASTAAVVKKSGVASEPVQKTTPGPKRAAAPQLPVIQ